MQPTLHGAANKFGSSFLANSGLHVFDELGRVILEEIEVHGKSFTYRKDYLCLLDSKQVVQDNGLVNNTGMFTLSDTHCRHHHQLDTMCLGVHFAVCESIHFGIQIHLTIC